MTDQAPNENPAKDPEEWVTGDEPMTGPQRSYLETLAREAGEEVPEDLTKAQASEAIERLPTKTGRGRVGAPEDQAGRGWSRQLTAVPACGGGPGGLGRDAVLPLPTRARGGQV